MSDDTPTVTRDGGRAWINTGLDSPYATRLRRFGAHWDSAIEAWWVGVGKANKLDELLARPLGDSCDDQPQSAQSQAQSAAAVLVTMALDDYTLGVTDSEDTYGVRPDRPHIARMLRGGRTGLRQDLAHKYFVEYGAPPPQQALADACGVIEAYAALEQPRPVHLRVAEHAGAVYIDVGDADCHVIEISGGEWYYNGCTAPVLFRRTKLSGVLPKPIVGGDLSKLWRFVPIRREDRPLVLAWLVSALIHADVSHTILALLAEHGSVKSTSTRCLVDLLDPSSVPLRKAPRDADSWVTAATASWVVALDNLSGVIPLWLSDCLCRSSTGEGDVRRQLYTDNDVAVFAYRRVVMFNGVDVEVTQGDLADRLLRVDLPRVAEDNHRTDKQVAAEWAAAKPGVFGALLDLAADVHARLPQVSAQRLPRMADYARVLAAVDAIHGTTGLTHYRERRQRAASDTLEGSFIARMIKLRSAFDAQTSAQILTALTPADDKWKEPKDWPSGARAVTAQLTRHAPALRTQGWTIDNDDARNELNRLRWTICPPPQPEKDRIPDSSDSSDSSEADNRTSNSMRVDESEHGLYGDPDSSPDSSNSSGPADSSKKGPLTCEDELTSQTSQKYTSSLVAEEDTVVCLGCGDVIPAHMPMARTRGYCFKPDCSDAANDDEVPF